jgi:uncharacterized membrane protein YhfC
MASPPSSLFLLSGAGMICVAAISVLAWQKRHTEPLWRFVWIGALAWMIGVGLKFGFSWAMPIDDVRLARWLGNDLGRPAHWLYVGLLTGVFECGATWLFVTKSRVRQASWEQAVAFGLGFGAIEAFLVGILSLAGLAAAILFWKELPRDEQAAVLQSTSSLISIAIPTFERIVAIAGHAASCVLIVWAVQRREARWFWLAFAYKTFIDGFGAWGIFSFGVKASLAKMIEFEVMSAAPAALLVGYVFYRHSAEPRVMRGVRSMDSE